MMKKIKNEMKNVKQIWLEKRNAKRRAPTFLAWSNIDCCYNEGGDHAEDDDGNDNGDGDDWQ